MHVISENASSDITSKAQLLDAMQHSTAQNAVEELLINPRIERSYAGQP